jgi:hypothetical protein
VTPRSEERGVGVDGDRTIRLERREPEERHHALADREILEAGRQLPWAASPEVVDQVVAVRSDAQLAQPAENDRRGRIDVDRAEQLLTRTVDQVVARVVLGALTRPGAPSVDHRAAKHKRTVPPRSVGSSNGG